MPGKPRDYTFPKDATLLGLITNAGEQAARKGAGLLSKAAGERTRAELGGILGASGPELDAAKLGILAALSGRARSQALVQGLLANPAAVPAIVAGRRNLV